MGSPFETAASKEASVQVRNIIFDMADEIGLEQVDLLIEQMLFGQTRNNVELPTAVNILAIALIKHGFQTIRDQYIRDDE